ncbi:hypothetical protein ACQ4LE_007299 [Meloidogyne hapla]|uniref:Clc-like protein n=1 Tax=Meloidogyne hapla TaxID=6305 RepID=A0A1I8B974_MELHA
MNESQHNNSSSNRRNSFLFLGICLTLLGCIISIISIALPGWQILDLPELNALHEHAILYDCIISEVTPLNALPRIHRDGRKFLPPLKPARQCTYKFEGLPSWQTSLFVRMAFEEGDFGAREHLNNHRFLPQHKAVLFFCVFTSVFSFLSIFVGACSSCFLPNAILHSISVGLATSCSILADISFWIAAENDIGIRGSSNAVYQQHLSYAFFIHCLGSLILLISSLFSILSAYLLLLRECRKRKLLDKNQKRDFNEKCFDKKLNEKSLQEDLDSKCLLLSDLFSIERAALTNSLEVLPPPPPGTPQQNLNNLIYSSNYSLISSGGFIGKQILNIDNVKCSDV